MAGRTYPRPEGEFPRHDKPCPLCNAAVGHAWKCPWSLWAVSPEPAPWHTTEAVRDGR